VPKQPLGRAGLRSDRVRGVVIERDSDGQLIALDATTGKERWRAEHLPDLG
jgi:outer membrane protein assembly factor BamB